MFCPNCGKEYFENQNFCRYCGTKLRDDESLENSQTENGIINESSCENNAQEEVQNTVDLTIKNDTTLDADDKEVEEKNKEESSENSPEENKEKEDEEEQESIKEEVSDFFSDLKKSLIIETEEGKKLTPSAITLLVVLFIFVVFMANLLWSINDAIQINPSMTNDNALMNIPNDNENGAYTQEPEVPAEEEPTDETAQEEQPQDNHEFAEQQNEEPPLVPIEEIRQREQQFPEPEIPMPQDFPDENTH